MSMRSKSTDPPRLSDYAVLLLGCPHRDHAVAILDGRPYL
jgi:hypothetical protein